MTLLTRRINDDYHVLPPERKTITANDIINDTDIDADNVAGIYTEIDYHENFCQHAH